MKKILPFLLLILGILVLASAYFLVIKPKNESIKENNTQEEVVPEVPIEQRPIVSLTPSNDGHWLTLEIKDIRISAENLEYLLLYDLPDGRQQGVPGTVKLAGENMIERKLLLGSESSGKFRYDEGVEKGTITIKFRDKQGKLVAKFSGDFHLQNGTDNLSSVDGSFTFKLSKIPKTGYFVIMETFGIPEGLLRNDISFGPYGLYSSSDINAEGNISMQAYPIYYWNGKEWIQYNDSTPINIGDLIVVGFH